ncbi:MAG: nicotinate (nicotinamide) nucleotide adenylyltransferase [Desulfobacterales bacterium]|nr:MAG: nicotinate (nicotinamide) nucleotide adenylyltransferase [Desulfobacterales bacterium]
MRIGLFGGTFNPIHLGHLRATIEVKEGFNLDKIFLIPAALPPHKMPGSLINADDRLEMINMAISGLTGISVSDVELNRSGPSYTIDTVHHFKRSFSKDTQIYLIMGLDAFLEIDTWKSYEELLEQIAFIVIARPNQGYPDARLGWKILDDYLKANISEDYDFSESRSCYDLADSQPIHIFDVTALDISSSKIRELVNKGRSIEFLVPRRVVEFIKSKGLYT